MIAVRDHLDQFGDARIAVVTFATPERLAAYREHLHLPFDVVAETDRTLYRLLGAERGSNRQVWSEGTIRMYARLVRSGRWLGRPTEDIQQTDLYNLDRRRRRMSVAASMQWDLLPPLVLKAENVAVAGLVEPAYDVGGDCFDCAVNGEFLASIHRSEP